MLLNQLTLVTLHSFKAESNVGNLLSLDKDWKNKSELPYLPMMWSQVTVPFLVKCLVKMISCNGLLAFRPQTLNVIEA